MSLFLQHPAFLALLALGALPLIVHLVSRARPPEYRFSNIDFLRRVLRRTARVRRPKDWLLLALRTLTLLALAAAFISPFLISKNAALPGSRSTVVILIDKSASMAAREGAGSRFETACARAATLLENAHPTAANLIWMDAEPDAAFPDPGPNISYLTQLLNQAEPAPEPAALAAAFDLALRQLANVQGHRELIVISDFQASAWKDFAPALPPDLVVRTITVATTAPANLAVTRLLAQPAQPVIGQETTVLAKVRNFSPDAVRSQLTLDADGSRQSQAIDLPPWGETETAFTLRPADSGPLALTASIAPDAFPGDDARHAILTVRGAIRVAQDAPADATLTKLVAALPWLESTAQAAPGDIRALSTWSDAAALRADAERGITILIHDAAQADVQPLLGIAAPLESSPDGWQILPAADHPAIRLFKTGDFGNPFAGTFRERLKLPADLPNIRLIASYSDGVPAIFEIPTTAAPILFFNLPLDPAKSTWTTQGSFLPAFAEILLRTRPDEANTAAPILPGSPLTRLSTDPAQAGAITLTGPDGAPVATQPTATETGEILRSATPAVPGIYRWEISGQPIALTAVNFPDSESDLRPLSAAPTFGKRSTAADGSLASQAALARGVPLWPWLVLAALACLLAESLINLRLSRPISA